MRRIFKLLGRKCGALGSVLIALITLSISASEPESMIFETSVPDNPKVICRYKIAEKGGSENWVVLFFHYPRQRDAHKSRLFKELMEIPNISPLVLQFEVAPLEESDDTKRFYYYPESGSGEAYVSAVQKIADLSKFSKYKLLLVGESGGGSAAQLFAARYPELVESIIVTGGGKFRAPEKKSAIRWNIIHTRRDWVEPANVSLVSALRDRGEEVFYVTTSPEWKRRGNPSALFEHCPNEDAFGLMEKLIGMTVSGKLPDSQVDVNRWNSLPGEMAVRVSADIKTSLEILPPDPMKAAPPQRCSAQFPEGELIECGPRSSADLRGKSMLYVCDYESVQSRETAYNVMFLQDQGVRVVLYNVGESEKKSQPKNGPQVNFRDILKDGVVFSHGGSAALESAISLGGRCPLLVHSEVVTDRAIKSVRLKWKGEGQFIIDKNEFDMMGFDKSSENMFYFPKLKEWNLPAINALACKRLVDLLGEK